MQCIRLFFIVFIVWSVSVSVVLAADEEFDSEEILSNLESQLELSSEKLSRLKPVIDAKSAELKKSMHETVDKGFMQLEELNSKLDAASRDAEKKVSEFLNSEEIEKLKDYLSKIDEDAIREMKEKLDAELSAVLELTEEQAAKLKPLFEDSLTQLSEMLERLAKEGSKNWEEFRGQYENLSKELREKLQDTLDSEQMKRLDRYNEEKKEKIQVALFSA
ncbi:MAG: hypothetical protein GQ559_09865 [Desulfobulbaceae bacterium]|nr:hypothetical protein [Desulfobulbaceae bacterium]